MSCVVEKMMVKSNPSGLSRQHTIETPLLLETIKLIAAANMGIANPDLRDTCCTGALGHSGAQRWIPVNGYLGKLGSLFIE